MDKNILKSEAVLFVVLKLLKKSFSEQSIDVPDLTSLLIDCIFAANDIDDSLVTSQVISCSNEIIGLLEAHVSADSDECGKFQSSITSIRTNMSMFCEHALMN